MVNGLAGVAEVVAWREEVIRSVLGVLSAERHLSDEETSAAALTEAEEQLALAARGLARATDLLPAGRRPKGWVR